jgi:hypothetical protein
MPTGYRGFARPLHSAASRRTAYSHGGPRWPATVVDEGEQIRLAPTRRPGRTARRRSTVRSRRGASNRPNARGCHTVEWVLAPLARREAAGSAPRRRRHARTRSHRPHRGPGRNPASTRCQPPASARSAGSRPLRRGQPRPLQRSGPRVRRRRSVRSPARSARPPARRSPGPQPVSSPR